MTVTQEPRAFEAPPRPFIGKVVRTALFVFPLLLAVWRLGQCILIAAPSDASCVWVYVKATAVGSVLVGLAVGSRNGETGASSDGRICSRMVCGSLRTVGARSLSDGRR